MISPRISDDDKNLINRDAGLPGLKILLDPSSFADALRLADPKIEWGTVTPEYVRYKAGMNCLVGYRVNVPGSSLRMYAKAYSLDAEEKLAKANERQIKARASGHELYIIENAAICIHPFPSDNKLNSLWRLTQTEARDRLFKKLFPKSKNLQQGILQDLRYKPERRYVGRVIGKDGTSAALKIYTEHAFPTAVKAAKAFSSRKVLRVPKRLGVSLSRFAQSFEWLPGFSLSEILRSTNKNIDALYQVGQALAELHAQKVSGLASISRKEEAESLSATVSAVADICPGLADSTVLLAGRIRERLLAEPEIRRPCHGDFYADQVLVHDKKVGILDFDRAGFGDPVMDMGSFLAHLERDVIYQRISANEAERCRQSIIAGYQKNLPQPSPHLLGTYKAMALMRLALEPFRYREPDWGKKVHTLLEKAREAELADKKFHINNQWAKRIPSLTDEPTLVNTVAVEDPYHILTDPAFLTITDALAPIKVQGELNNVFSKLGAGPTKIVLRAIRVTRYKPGRRCLIEYDLDITAPGLPPESLTCIGKVHAHKLDMKTYELNKKLQVSGFDPGNEEQIFVPEPIGYISDWRMWISRKVPGAPVTGVITQPGGIQLAERMAQVIHKLQACQIPSNRLHTISDELSTLHERLTGLIIIKPQWAERIKRVLSACDRLGNSLTNQTMTIVHRDFYPDQVLVDGEKLYLLDLDMYSNGDIGLDAGNFIGHLTEHSIRIFGDPEALVEHEMALEEKFLKLAGLRFRLNVKAYALLTLVRHISISQQFAERQPFTESILDLCEQRLRIGSAFIKVV